MADCGAADMYHRPRLHRLETVAGLRSVRRYVKFPFHFILAGVFFGVAGTGQGTPADSPTVFVNVNIVHPELNTVVRGQTIVVTGATILQIGPSAELKPA